MKIKNMIIMVLFLMIIPLSGCSDSSELHQKLIVQGIGIDAEKEGYKVTIQAYDYQSPTPDGDPTLKVLELSGRSVMEAFSSIYKQTGLKPLYSQNMLVVLGEGTAENGVSKIIDFFIRHYEVRPDVKICVAKGRAEDVIKCETLEGYIKAKDISNLIYDKCDVIHFVGMIRDGVSSPSVTALKVQNNEESGEKRIVSEGIACFKRDTLAGFTNETETKGIEIINGACEGKTYIVDLKNNYKASCTIKKISKEIKPVISDEGVSFNIHFKVDAGVFEITGQNISSASEASKEEIEKSLALYINNLSKQAIDKIALEYKADIFRLSKVLMNANPDYFKSLESVENTLEKANYNIDSEVKISVFGTEIIF